MTEIHITIHAVDPREFNIIHIYLIYFVWQYFDSLVVCIGNKNIVTEVGEKRENTCSLVSSINSLRINSCQKHKSGTRLKSSQHDTTAIHTSHFPQTSSPHLSKWNIKQAFIKAFAVHFIIICIHPSSSCCCCWQEERLPMVIILYHN